MPPSKDGTEPPLTEVYHESLLDRMDGSIVESAFDDADFLPEGAISRLIIRENVELELPNATSGLVNFICKDAMKVFAITLYCGIAGNDLCSVMESFQRHSFVDAVLPIRMPLWGGAEVEIEQPEYLTGFRHPVWTKAHIRRFCRNQWMLLAPVFNKTQFLYNLDHSCPLPFTWGCKIDENLLTEVYEVKIHEDHQLVVQVVISKGYFHFMHVLIQK